MKSIMGIKVVCVTTLVPMPTLKLWPCAVMAKPMSRVRRAAARGNGLLISVQKGSGHIVNAGSCEWVAGLITQDADTQTITRNVLSQFSQMMPDDGIEQLRQFDAIYLGAVGFPGVPDHISLWGLLIPIRREFDQYINLRPVRLFDGVPCPLANKTAGDIDMMIVRENVEGEYSNIGGIQYEGTEQEVVIQQSVFTRRGVDRVINMLLNLAQSSPRKHLSSATKSNGIIHSMPYWDNALP